MTGQRARQILIGALLALGAGPIGCGNDSQAGIFTPNPTPTSAAGVAAVAPTPVPTSTPIPAI
jgi:hypothetical protein